MDNNPICLNDVRGLSSGSPAEDDGGGTDHDFTYGTGDESEMIRNPSLGGPTAADAGGGATPASPSVVSKNQDDPYGIGKYESKIRNPEATVNTIFSLLGGQEAYSKYPHRHVDMPKYGSFGNQPQADAVKAMIRPDTYNRRVGGTKFFYAETGQMCPDDFALLMLGFFVNGQGPEVWVFDKGTDVSNAMMHSSIIDDVLKQWLAEDVVKNEWLPNEDNEDMIEDDKLDMLKDGTYWGGYGLEAQATDALRDKSFWTVPNFIGSANVSVKVLKDKGVLELTIVNVTSITSGDFLKHVPMMDYPMSIVRDGDCIMCIPYSNIAQIIILEVPIPK